MISFHKKKYDYDLIVIGSGSGGSVGGAGGGSLISDGGHGVGGSFVNDGLSVSCSNCLVFGGAGGAGYFTSGTTAFGGAGGGIIFGRFRNIYNYYTLYFRSDGASGISASPTSSESFGGGGGGGSIMMNSNYIYSLAYIDVQANGGSTGSSTTSSSAVCGGGGAGGYGTIYWCGGTDNVVKTVSGGAYNDSPYCNSSGSSVGTEGSSGSIVTSYSWCNN